MRIIFYAIIGFLIYTHYFGDESGCDQYASSHSCDYVEKKARYEVWYWIDVEKNNPRDERYIGSVTGLSNCRDMAISYHRMNESFRPWNSRSYICALVKDGRRMEKHR